MELWSNLDFKIWLTEANASGLSQEHLKLEAMKFSGIFDNVDKKTISKLGECVYYTIPCNIKFLLQAESLI